MDWRPGRLLERLGAVIRPDATLLSIARRRRRRRPLRELEDLPEACGQGRGAVRLSIRRVSGNRPNAARETHARNPGPPANVIQGEMELLVLLVIAGVALVVLPLLLIKLVVALVLLPFKLLGLLLKAAFGVISVVGVLLLGLLALVVLPLLPVLLLGGLVWLIVRASRRPDAPRLTA